MWYSIIMSHRYMTMTQGARRSRNYLQSLLEQQLWVLAARKICIALHPLRKNRSQVEHYFARSIENIAFGDIVREVLYSIKI